MCSDLPALQCNLHTMTRHHGQAWWLRVTIMIFADVLAKGARVGSLGPAQAGNPNVKLDHHDAVKAEEQKSGCRLNVPSLVDARKEERDGSVLRIHWMPGICAEPRPPVPAEGPTHRPVRPKGVFLLLHAAGHQARSFFQLPEESEMTLSVLYRGYVALAVETYPEYGGSAWDLLHDGPLVRDSLNSFLEKYGLQDLPVFGIGVSNGGNFLHYLFAMLNVKFAGLHFNVSPGGYFSGNAPGMFAVKPHPPVAFTCMLHDGYTPKAAIRHAVSYLRDKGTPVQYLPAPPQPVGSLVLWADKAHINREVAAKMVKLMHVGGYTVKNYYGSTTENNTESTSQFKYSPLFYRRYLQLNSGPKVMEYLSKDPEVGDIANAKWAQVSEEINVIEGQHSPTAMRIRETLEFLLSNSAWNANLKVNTSVPELSNESESHSHRTRTRKFNESLYFLQNRHAKYLSSETSVPAASMKLRSVLFEKSKS